MVFDCLVAITEACAQALHGRGERVGEPSKITWTIERQRADFCIEDYSKARVADAAHPKRRIHEVIERETGMKGLGNDVMQRLMDEVEVEETDVSRSVKLMKLLS